VREYRHTENLDFELLDDEIIVWNERRREFHRLVGSTASLWRSCETWHACDSETAAALTDLEARGLVTSRVCVPEVGCN
jgi:hypothetical protein